METPICVTDAQTFVDYIHQIKKWIYDGQLRLVIPSGFSDNVEALYKKSLESKSTPKEAPKAKVFGKPTKKEYPTFDANPKVAREYLARLQAGKDFETGASGRPIYENEESQNAVHLARASEQYSAWKELDDYEEKPEVPAGSESWADKLRRRQIVMNEQNENKTKGPVKPKLVAKTGADNSPWKVQKNAPTISGIEVPVPLRPMMSFSLWRIHESIHRNDENQVYVLTSGPSVKKVAQKLNIDVRSPADLSKVNEASKPQVDLNTFGGLEEEFGVRPVKERRVIKCTAVKGTPSNPAATLEQNGITKQPAPLDQPQNETSDLLTKPRPQWIRQSSTLGKPNDKYNDPSLKKVQSSGTLRGQEIQSVSNNKQKAVNGLMDKIRQISGSGTSTPVQEKQSDGSGQLTNGNVKAMDITNVVEPTSGKTSDDDQKLPKDEPANINREMSSSTNAWSRSWAEMLSGEQGRKPSPVPERNAEVTLTMKESVVSPPAPDISEQSRPASDTPAEKPISQSQAIVEPLPAMPSIPDAASSSLDSDEEIVVFKPKSNRLSAQKKPVKQTSRPTTPNTQSKVTPTPDAEPPQDHTPQAPNNDSKKQATPKVTPRQRQTPKQVNDLSGGRRATLPPAPVIDPDAFGRDFAVNTHVNKGSVRGSRVRHSPQPSLFDAGVNPSRPTSSHRPHRRSPSRVSPNLSPAQNLKLPVEPTGPSVEAQRRQTPPTSAPRGPTSGQRRNLPIGSGRPSISPAQDSPPQRVVTLPPAPSFSPPPSIPTLNANAPVFQPGGMGNALLQPAFQPDFGTPKSNPPIQPPIGSGRPSSKTSQLKGVEPVEPPFSPTDGVIESTQEPVRTDSSPLRELTLTPPKGPRNSEPNFARRPTFPQQGIPQPAPIASKADQAPAATSNGNRFNRPAPFRNGDFHRGRGGRSGVNVRRPVKPVLFEPDLDHTRAFQPDTVEPKKTAQPDVQYVLKSGSTREEARGKGRLWVG